MHASSAACALPADVGLASRVLERLRTALEACSDRQESLCRAAVAAELRNDVENESLPYRTLRTAGRHRGAKLEADALLRELERLMLRAAIEDLLV